MPRNPRSAPVRPWLLAAALLALLGVGAVVLALVTEDSVERATPSEHDLVATTPVLSARRVPELLARPVAARNLRRTVAPIVAAAPPESCLEVRDTSSVLVAERALEPVVPASNMKLITAAAALELLDPDERLTTRFVTDGAPTDGSIVRGNLYVIGGGDPMLSTSAYLAQLPNGIPPHTDLAEVADQLAATGIREVTGSVVGDESRYDTQRTVPTWPERYLAQGQVGPLSALMVDDAWRAGLGPAPDPALHAASVLTDLLEERGVRVQGPPEVGPAPEDAPLLTEVPSLTVAELVAQTLAFSDNTTAELLVKEIGLRHGGDGSTDAGLSAIRDWMERVGLPLEGAVVLDGSGLSEESRLSCTLLAELLTRAGPTGTIADGLARPGEPGTLQDRLRGDQLDGRVRAKTGTLRPVTALSGWLRTRAEIGLAFAFVVNTFDRQVGDADLALQGQLLTAMLGHPEAPPLQDLSPVDAGPPP